MVDTAAQIEAFLVGPFDPLGATHDFNREQDRRKRVAQLVRQHRQELVLSNTGVPELFLGAGAFEGLPGPLGGLLDELNLLWSPARGETSLKQSAATAGRP